jgi:2-keto-4-pentenoate hydratase/2-oxohepta-3-ene-1,7-dioic acid hydratase in catechol pathway
MNDSLILDGKPFSHPLGKIVCVGRNYADHAKELNNPVPAEPLLFIKPATAFVSMEQPFSIPVDQGACHFETEMALLIGKPLSGHKVSELQADAAVVGVGLAFDLTLRELQEELKEKKHPWEKGKGFDGSCPLSRFVSRDVIANWQDVQLRMTRNNKLRQDGNSREMLTPTLKLLSYITRYFSLLPGDVVLTGTPAGVGPLAPGDKLEAELVGILQVSTEVTGKTHN